jgi:hypothetical protein
MKLLLILSLLQVPILSKYLSFAEATRTSAGAACIPNADAISPEQIYVLQQFGLLYFDPLRERAKGPLYVSSLFRSRCINTNVGGAKNSEHMILGDVAACDIDQDGKGKIGNRALFFMIKDGPPFRQLIWEFGDTKSPGWVHVSWSTDPKKNIRKVYRATRINNRVIYQLFNPY